MGVKKDFDEQAGGQRRYHYLSCPGKWASGEDGQRRKVCSGHLFPTDSRFVECPYCGTTLEWAVFDEPQDGVKRFAMKECAKCKERDRGWGTANGCVDGEKREGGRIRKFYGGEGCGGCLCAKCCAAGREAALAFDTGDWKLEAAVRRRMMPPARRAAREPKSPEAEAGFLQAAEAVKRDPVLGRLPPRRIDALALRCFDIALKSDALKEAA